MPCIRIFGLAVLLTASLLSIAAHGAHLPPLAPPVLYEGVYSHDGGSYQVLLSLEKYRGFVLREHITLANGKVSSWDVTGKWHQIRNGAFLQLTNRSSFERLLNVGSEGDLYLDARLPAGKQATVVLREKKSASWEFSISGLLRVKGGETSFLDPDSDIVYSLLPGQELGRFLEQRRDGEQELPVRLLAVATGKNAPLPALRVLEVHSIPREKKWDALDRPGNFQDIIIGAPWIITPIAREMPPGLYWVAFLPDPGNSGGKLEIFDGKWHHFGEYALKDHELSFTAPLMNRHFAWVIRRTRQWRLAGEVLELWDDKQLLAVLEKASP